MTLSEAPVGIPQNVRIVNIKEHSFDVSFTQISQQDRPTEYEIIIINTRTYRRIVKQHLHRNFGLPTVTVTIDGLDSGVAYTVQVRASNRVGPGTLSKYMHTTTVNNTIPTTIKITTTMTTPTTKNIPTTIPNVNVVPTMNSESSSVKISWEPASSQHDDYSYQITYCEINRPTTCKTVIEDGMQVVLSGLKRNLIYSYKIVLLIKGRQTSAVFESVFRTNSRGIDFTFDQF